MDPVTLSIAAGLTAFNGVTGAISQNKQNKANKDLAKYQHDLNVDFWHQQNEYNNPTNTMQRLVDAGINPRAYNKVGEFANAGTPPSYERPEYKSPLGAFSHQFNQIAPMLTTLASLDKIQSDVDVNKSIVNLNDKKATTEWLRSILIDEQGTTERDNRIYNNWRRGYVFDVDKGTLNILSPFGYQAQYDDAILKDIQARYGLNLSKDNMEKLLIEMQERDNDFFLSGQTGKLTSGMIQQTLQFLLRSILKR